MNLRNWIATFAIAAGSTGLVLGAEPETPKGAKVPEPSLVTFGTLRAMPSEMAKIKLSGWLKEKGKLDAAALDSIWASDKSLMEKTLDGIALGNPAAKAAIVAARDITASAPTEVPAAIAEEKDAFVRANLGSAYARALAGKKVYEEALLAVKDVQTEQMVDPAAFFFFKSVAEHSLAGYQKIKKLDAVQSVVRLLDDVVDAPDRYKMVATLMFFDMQNWSKDDKDLGNIGKLMDNSGRRLDLARGGSTTQDIQKRIVFRLDEKIKELENKAKGGNCNGGSCPSGGQPGNPNGQGNTPAKDSQLPSTGTRDGKVDEKKLGELAQVWGKLPEAERIKIAQEIVRDAPAKYKPYIEEYFKSLNNSNGYGKK